MGLINSAIATPLQDPPLLEQVDPEIRWLVDNDQAYAAIAAAIAAARHSISISQLALDADFAGPSRQGPIAQHAPFIELLLSAARDRDVSIRILLNKTILLDTLRPLRRFIAAQPDVHHRIRMRGISFFPGLLHAKMVIVDSSTAFLVGSPFVNGYWDSQAHAPVDATRPHRELSGRPLHDVSVQMTGKGALAVVEFFEQLWQVGKGDPEGMQPKASSRDTHLKTRARIDTTVPAGVSGFGNGSTAILRTLRSAIRRANSLIYVEQQYLSSRRVCLELQRALARNSELEIIIVANQNADITAYSRWQVSALREFGLLGHSRVGVFGLWSVAERNSRRDINQVFVHSKVVLIDDKWAMCGSANLDGVSLHSYGADFAGSLGRNVFKNVRNFDIAMSVDGLDETDSLDTALSLRQELWSEHLGLDFDPNRARPANGWLSIWRAAASSNIEMLNSGFFPGEGSFILPYSTSTKPFSQLRECGIDLKRKPIHLHFNPGWFARSFGLGWVLNMFL